MSGDVVRLLTDEERKAVESAQGMTPLTLLMVVGTIKAEARREGSALAWDEVAQALAWAQDAGLDSIRYVKENNPYRDALRG